MRESCWCKSLFYLFIFTPAPIVSPLQATQGKDTTDGIASCEEIGLSRYPPFRKKEKRKEKQETNAVILIYETVWQTKALIVL